MNKSKLAVTNPFAFGTEPTHTPRRFLENIDLPTGELLARAFMPDLDASPRQRLAWCIEHNAVRRATSGDDATELLHTLRRRRGNCSAEQALDLFDRFRRGLGLPEHEGRAYYWLRIAADLGSIEAQSTALLMALNHLTPLMASEREDRDALIGCARHMVDVAMKGAAASLHVISTDPVGLMLTRIVDLSIALPDLLDGRRYDDLAGLMEAWITLPARDAIMKNFIQAYLGARNTPTQAMLPLVERDGHLTCTHDFGSDDLQRRFGVLTRRLPFKDAPEPASLRTKLDAEFPWLREMTTKLVGHMALRQSVGNTAFHLPPLLLVGHPGSGKTRYAQRLLEFAGIPSRLLSLAGASDNRALQGTARGWNTSQPSLIVQTMASEEVANPSILLDEIDKVSPSRRNGNAWDTLHLLLDPRTAAQWFDECLLVPCDLSPVTFIATANSLAPLPRSLLSRFTLYYVPAPSDADRWSILSTLLRDVAADLGTVPDRLPRLRPEDWERLFASCGESIRDSKRLLHDLFVKRLCDDTQPKALH